MDQRRQQGSQDIGRPELSPQGIGKTPKAASNSRRKADGPPRRSLPSKKAKGNTSAMSGGGAGESDGEGREDDDGKTDMPDEEKRKNILERNRIAALKCRQRKKQWLANLHNKVEMFGSENGALTARITQLRLEALNLKTLLLAHKGCPVTQQQGLHSGFRSQEVEPFNAQINSSVGVFQSIATGPRLQLN